MTITTHPDGYKREEDDSILRLSDGELEVWFWKGAEPPKVCVSYTEMINAKPLALLILALHAEHEKWAEKEDANGL